MNLDLRQYWMQMSLHYCYTCPDCDTLNSQNGLCSWLKQTFRKRVYRLGAEQLRPNFICHLIWQCNQYLVLQLFRYWGKQERIDDQRYAAKQVVWSSSKSWSIWTQIICLKNSCYLQQILTSFTFASMKESDYESWGLQHTYIRGW